MASLLLSTLGLLWSLSLFFDEFIVVDFGFPLGLYYISGLMLIGCSVVRGKISKGIKPAILMLFIVFLTIAVWSMYFSTDYLKSVFWLCFIIYNAVFIAALRGLICRNHQSMNSSAFLQISAIVVVLFGIYAYATGSLVKGRLVFHIDQNPAYLGGGICLLIISLWIIFVNQKKIISKLLPLILIPSLFVLLLLTQARNPLVGMVVGFVFALLIMFTRRVLTGRTGGYNLRYVGASKVVAAFSLIFLVSVSAPFIDKFELPIDRVMLLFSKEADMEDVTAGRLSRWIQYTSFAAQSFWPQGLGRAEAAIPGLGDPHNVFLRVLVELSALGLLVFVIFHMYLIYLTLRTESMPLVWLAAYLLFIGLGNDVVFQRDYWFGLSLLCLFYPLSVSNRFPRKGQVRGDAIA